MRKVLAWVLVILAILQVVLIVLRLTHVVSWPVLFILGPLCIALVVIVLVMAVKLMKEERGQRRG